VIHYNDRLDVGCSKADNSVVYHAAWTPRRHSLRAGHATSAAIAGASERSIMAQTGHRSVQMVRRYIRDGSLFRENSAGKLGL
jgi:integrase